MFKINQLSSVNFSGSKLRFLWCCSRCISGCFAGIRFARAGEQLRTLTNHCTNHSNFVSKSVRTLNTKVYGTNINRRYKNTNCFDTMSTSKDFSKGISSTQHVQNFSFVSKDVLPDESTEEKYDVNDKNIAHEDTNKSKRKFGPHEYEFDVNGYLSVNDVVKFLRHEAAFDICVIETSGAKRAYVDYFIVVSGVSNRHIRAMSKNLEQLFRGNHVRGISKQGHVTVEGLESDSNWLAVDIGNMVVHFFLPELRQLYELEKLWTLGPRFDDQYKVMLEDEEFLQAVFLGEETKNPDQED